MKFMSKMNYCSRVNLWCNLHVITFWHLDSTDFQRSVDMVKWLFLVILVILAPKLGHFPFEIGPKTPWDYQTGAQELTSGAICMFWPWLVWIWECFNDQWVWGSFCSLYPRGNFDIFCSFQNILALYGPVLMKMVSKLKIFWCSNWSWKFFFF